MQPEIDRRINECGDCRKRNQQHRRDLVEREANAEAVILNLQVPELVLQDNGHFVRKTLTQALWNVHAGGTGFERDIEVVHARKHASTGCNLAQHTANNRAQGLLHDFVVGDQTIGCIAHSPTTGLGDGSGQVGTVIDSQEEGRIGAFMRTGSITRKTEETDIAVSVNLDGTGTYKVETGIGFLDHMIEQFSRHSLIDIECRVRGDLHVDQHHTTEDSAIALGQAIAQALGDKKGITRYGHTYSPMDEALCRVALDISGRPVLVWKAAFTQPRLGEMDTELFEHWFASISQAAGITLHIESLYGSNNHHIVEGIYKGFARAMRQAIAIDPRKADAVPSTKGILGG